MRFENFLIRCLAFFAIGLVLSGALDAQGSDEPENVTPDLGFSDSLEVNLVNIDVYVRDKKGRPVTDLGVKDFVVWENGEKRKITNFTVLNEEVFRTFQREQLVAPEAMATKKDDTQAGPQVDIRPTWVVLYIDQENLHPLDRTRVLRRVREFVNESLIPPVQMMVVANEGSLKVKQPFTSDAREVTSVLRGMGKFSGGWLDRESTRADLVDRMRDLKGEKGQGTNSKGNRQLFQEVVAYAREEAFTLSQSLGALHQVVDMLAGIDGRKSVIYVSNGLPMTPGLGLMHEYATSFHDNSILAYRARFEKQAQYRSLASSAASQEVTLHTLDAGGLDVTIGGEAESSYGSDPTATQVGSSNFQSSLRYLARRTGGIAIINTNDVSGGLKQVRNDLYAYYSIGFPVKGLGRDTVHTVKVEVPGRSGLDIRHRGRFVHKSLETTVQDQVISALLLGVNNNPMGIIIDQENPIPAMGERWTVPITISVPMSSLALLPAGDELVGHIVLVAGARDDEGGQSDVQREEHEIKIPADADLSERRWTLDSRFLMAEGKHRIVVGILDQITRKASYAVLNLRVP